MRRAAVALAAPALRLATKIFPRQSNTFAMIAEKPDALWPWLQRLEGAIVFNRGWRG